MRKDLNMANILMNPYILGEEELALLNEEHENKIESIEEEVEALVDIIPKTDLDRVSLSEANGEGSKDDIEPATKPKGSLFARKRGNEKEIKEEVKTENVDKDFEYVMNDFDIQKMEKAFMEDMEKEMKLQMEKVLKGDDFADVEPEDVDMDFDMDKMQEEILEMNKQRT